MNSGGYLPSRKAARLISTTFTNTEVNNCFSIYHTSWITRSPKSNFIRENIATKAILFFISCSEVNSTWLITSELANQCTRKVLFTCVVCSQSSYSARKRQPSEQAFLQELLRGFCTLAANARSLAVWENKKNRPFLNNLVPLFQNESKVKNLLKRGWI